ncbi:MAG TPA: zf-TFIIB domain-containing protein [Anaeromyxobacteraceae bacterium]|nr:zf-TFIIB domain-containing protein [Anaeromyxobacteraceae bacterium]
MSDSNVVKPSTSEDEYFVKEDAEKKRKIALQVKKETALEEQRRLKELHWMHCPKCGMEMSEVKYGGVDVDVCFACGGIYLDRGEIEHLQKKGPSGVMGSILNWFRDETKAPGSK